MERTPCQNWYDWYLDCFPVAHLRYLEGELGSTNHWRSLSGLIQIGIICEQEQENRRIVKALGLVVLTFHHRYDESIRLSI